MEAMEKPDVLHLRRAEEAGVTARVAESGRAAAGRFATALEAPSMMSTQTRPHQIRSPAPPDPSASRTVARPPGLETAERQRQQHYLEQIAACRDEIQKLKAALRNEQERNHRLQQLLRGEL
jgi:MOSC domain-containing protein YiiM